MPRWLSRLALILGCLIVVFGGGFAAGYAVNATWHAVFAPESAASRHGASPSPQRSPESTNCPAPTVTYGAYPPVKPIGSPFRGVVPDSGYYQVPIPGTKDLQTVTIPHTAVVCGKPFAEYVDFTYLGDWPKCKVDPHALDNLRRPCDEPFKQYPDGRSKTLNGPEADTPTAKAWRPVEGKDRLTVVCQAIGINSVVGEGIIQDMRPQTASNVWNKILDARIPGGVGWIPDVWMGNAGFRGPLCPLTDYYRGP